MQSADYVPGVSGWKIDDHARLELNDGNRRIHAEVKLVITAGPGVTNDQAAQELRDFPDRDCDTPPTDEQLAALCLTRKDLAGSDDLVFAQAATDAITSLQEIVSGLITKVASLSGQVAAGMGVGIMPTEQPKPRDATQILEEISSLITETELGKDPTSRIVELEQAREKQAAESRSLYDRIVAIELALTARQGREDAAKAFFERRFEDLQNQISMLIAKSYP